jgi:outer membrane protein assembly factor BamB
VPFDLVKSIGKCPAATLENRLLLPGRRIRVVMFIFVAVLSGGFTLHPSQAADWPEFRGPGGAGHADSQSLPVHWDQATHVVWKVKIPGKGWSSPVIHRGKLFLTTAVVISKDQQASEHVLRTVCLDPSSGEIVWDTEVFRVPVGTRTSSHGKNSQASPTPIASGDRVYVHFGTMGTAALDLNGTVVWRNQSFSFDPVHGNGGSPILSGERLVFNCDGDDKAFVVALDCNTGATIWKTDRPSAQSETFSFATPLEISVNGQKQIVSPGSHAVCSYNSENGKELWRVCYPNRWSVIPRPVYAEGLVFICTGYVGPPSLLAIRPDGQGDVTETHVAWQTDKYVPHTPSPAVVGKSLFLISDQGIATCRDVATGELHWRERLGGKYSASPLVANGLIYIQSEEGECCVYEAAEEFLEQSRNDLGERSLASFAVWERAFYIRTMDHLYCIRK